MFINIIFDSVVIGRHRFLFQCPLYFFPYSRLSSHLLALSLCRISFLQFPQANIWKKTLVHEFISWSHTEWYLFFSRGEIVLTLVEASSLKIKLVSLSWSFSFSHQGQHSLMSSTVSMGTTLVREFHSFPWGQHSFMSSTVFHGDNTRS